VSYPPNERDWEPGDLVVYRCEDCMDRWDLIVPEPEGLEGFGGSDEPEE
jgi:hypothetical protein